MGFVSGELAERFVRGELAERGAVGAVAGVLAGYGVLGPDRALLAERGVDCCASFV